MPELDELFPEAAPEVTVAGDTVGVQLGHLGMDVSFDFEGVEVKRKDFDCQLSVRVSPGFPDAFPPTHFSGESSSGRDTFRRNLDGFFGKGALDWAKLLPKAYSLARTAYLQAAQSQNLADLPVTWDDQWQADGLWPADGVTILFGQGSHGKGHITTALALAVADGSPFLGRSTAKTDVLYLDYESNHRVATRRFNRHLFSTPGISGNIHYVPGRAIPVADQIDAIRRELTRTRSNALIVDSAIPATGSDPLKAEVVARLINALNTLGVPVWLLAHVTKGGEEEYPYGSVFWHNLARMTWFVKRTDDEDDGSKIHVAMFNRKFNEGPRQKPFGAEIRFDDPAGPITVSPYEITNDPVLAKGLTASKRMWDALVTPKLTSQLADELDLPVNTIHVTGRRMRGRVRSVVFPGEKEATWSRISQLQEPL